MKDRVFVTLPDGVCHFFATYAEAAHYIGSRITRNSEQWGILWFEAFNVPPLMFIHNDAYDGLDVHGDPEAIRYYEKHRNDESIPPPAFRVRWRPEKQGRDLVYKSSADPRWAVRT